MLRPSLICRGYGKTLSLSERASLGKMSFENILSVQDIKKCFQNLSVGFLNFGFNYGRFLYT